ncbi:helix-turn-helix domain-containing protein [Paenibacillus sp. SN-8-1]|uniref:helix-turn-helix domain-containing protein n=1 Tax=Paenibacillus sp. SN-8-1 TaxID=3435409 RepID=UPI003D9A0D7A
MGLLDLEFIKKRRQKLDLSLQEMAESLGFKNASTYMKYEEGTYSFKANHLPQLAAKLNCKIGNFFTDSFADLANKKQSSIEEEVI